jgi:dynein heavy chain 1
MLGSSIKDTYGEILKSRSDLETMTIEGTSTAQAVSFITFVQDLKRKLDKWSPSIEHFTAGQKTLERQRFTFGSDWLYVDQLQSEWATFTELLKRKDDSIRQQVCE